MTTSARSHPAERILERVLRAEQEVGRAGPAAEALFHRAGQWLVRQDYLDELIRRLGTARLDRQIPGLPKAGRWRGLWTLLTARLFAPRLRCASRAEAVCVKSSYARAFYLPEPAWTLKVLVHDRGWKAQAMRNEIQVRTRLAAWDAVPVPHLLGHQLQTEPLHLAEELIQGRPCRKSDAPLLARQLLPQLGRTFQSHGLEWRPLCQVAQGENIAFRLSEAIVLVAWEPAWGEPEDWRREAGRFLASAGSLPCSLTHGDLGLTNLLWTPAETVYLIDWEKAAVRPVILDLHKLLRDVPALEPAVRDLLGTLPRPAGPVRILSFEQQLFYSALANITRHLQPDRRETGRRLASRLQSTFAEASRVRRRLTSST